MKIILIKTFFLFIINQFIEGLIIPQKMISNQPYFSKSRVARDTNPYPPKQINQNLVRPVFRVNTYLEPAEDNWSNQNFKQNHYQSNFGYTTERSNLKNHPDISNNTENLPIYDFSRSAVSRYPTYETRGKSKSINKRVSNYKPKRKDSTKSVNNLPLVQRLKNIDYPSSKQQQKSMRATCQPLILPKQSKLNRKSIYQKNDEKSSFKKKSDSVYERNQKFSSTFTKRKASFEEYEPDPGATPYFNDTFKQPKLEDFEIGECKGQGRFGKVYIAVHKKTGMIVALKKIRKDSVRFMIEQFIKQLKIQQFMSHPNLVKIYGYFADIEHFYMLVQYMEEGSLYSFMKKQGKKLPQKQTALKMQEICQGIKYMHELNIVHRDMKPQNIVMTNGVCKICDFGWAAICQDRRSTYCGTLDYVCPEIADGKQYDSSVDIWCLGVMAYEMMCGKAPFYNISRQKTIENIKSCKIESYPPHLSRQAVKFIGMILQKNPQSRVTIGQLVNSQFLHKTQA